MGCYRRGLYDEGGKMNFDKITDILTAIAVVITAIVVIITVRIIGG